MKQRRTLLTPKARKSFAILGQNLKFARIRRRISVAMMGEMTSVSHVTWTAIEQCRLSVSMIGYISVLLCLNMHTDIEKVAADDVSGRELQDLQLLKRIHA